MSAEVVVGRVPGALAVLAAWQELNRRGAARLLDANQRRWGDV